MTWNILKCGSKLCSSSRLAKRFQILSLQFSGYGRSSRFVGRYGVTILIVQSNRFVITRLSSDIPSDSCAKIVVRIHLMERLQYSLCFKRQLHTACVSNRSNFVGCALMSDTKQRHVSWLFYFRLHSTNCQLSADFLRPPLIIYYNHHLKYEASFRRFIFKHLWKAIISIASLFLQSLLRSEFPHKRMFPSAFAPCSRQRPGMTQSDFLKTRRWDTFRRMAVRKACRFSAFMRKKNTMMHFMFLWRLCGLGHAPMYDLIGGNVSTSIGSMSASPWSRKMRYLVLPHNATIKHCCFIKFSLYGMGIVSKIKIHSVQKVLIYCR